MKKLMMMAVMFVASATAFAGDSDALKAILKAKSYAEAEQLVKSTLDQLASPAEKAKAYNKLVDLAMEDFDAQNAIVTENQVNKTMGKEEKPIDEKLMSEMAFAALSAAAECDKYDQQPNEKGKVSPKFAKKNDVIASVCKVQHSEENDDIEEAEVVNDAEAPETQAPETNNE